MNNAVKWGLIGGLGIVLFNTVLYLIEPVKIVSWWSFLDWLIYIPVMIKAGLDERADMGGHMSWGEALKPTFLCFVVASLIFIIYMFLMYNVVDPGLEEATKEYSLEMVETWSEYMSEEQTETTLEALESQEFGYPIGRTLYTFALRLLFPGFIFASICSLFVRRERPDDLALDQ